MFLKIFCNVFILLLKINVKMNELLELCINNFFVYTISLYIQKSLTIRFHISFETISLEAIIACLLIFSTYYHLIVLESSRNIHCHIVQIIVFNVLVYWVVKSIKQMHIRSSNYHLHVVTRNI